MANRAVCKFFRQGNCKFGDNCRFLHPLDAAPEPQRNTQSNNSNRFAAASGFGSGSGTGRAQQGNFRHAKDNSNNPRGGPAFGARIQDNQAARKAADDNRAANKFGVSAQTIESDLTIDRPMWILSCYGPGIDAPVQLFGGNPMETSPEELRCQTYLAAARNVLAEECAQRENTMYQAAQSQIMQVLNDIPGALQYMEAGAKQHPNRLDIVHATKVPRGWYFAKNNFRARNPRNQRANNPPLPNAALPSNFFQPANQVANQPANAQGFASQGLSLQTPHSFGQSFPASDSDAQMDTVTHFQPARASSGFGRLAPVSSGFGQPAQASSGFGQTSQASSGFGALQNPNAFASKLPDSTNPFGQNPQIFAKQGMAPSATFGSTQTADSFGGSFTQQSHEIQFDASTSRTSAFGSHPFQSVQDSASSQSVQATQVGPETTLEQGQPSSHAETRDMKGRLTSWNGHGVTHEGNNVFCQRAGGRERIWISEPNGAEQTLHKATITLGDLPPADQYPADVKPLYQSTLQTGVFPPGDIPELPPRPEWTSYHV